VLDHVSWKKNHHGLAQMLQHLIETLQLLVLRKETFWFAVPSLGSPWGVSLHPGDCSNIWQQTQPLRGCCERSAPVFLTKPLWEPNADKRKTHAFVRPCSKGRMHKNPKFSGHSVWKNAPSNFAHRTISWKMVQARRPNCHHLLSTVKCRL